jgi:hypothetical protein
MPSKIPRSGKRHKPGRKEGRKGLFLQQANQRVHFCLRRRRKCAHAEPDYPKPHEPTCPKSKKYMPPSKVLMSALEIQDLNKIFNLSLPILFGGGYWKRVFYNNASNSTIFSNKGKKRNRLYNNPLRRTRKLLQ